jgi:hypothetical protein
MNIILTSTALVALAEMGDKTQLLAILLATRFRKPLPIILGILVATLANHFLAALVGHGVKELLDSPAFRIAVALGFIGMGLWTLVPDKIDDDELKAPGNAGVFLSTTIAFFLVEMLAYSGGLDTSIILKWLQEIWLRGRDLHRRSRPGRGAGAGAQEGRAAGHQAENIFIEDLREEFVRDFVFPMFRANALYEGQYLLGTSIARPLIAKRQIEIANGRRRCRLPWRDRQGQRPGPLRARLLRAEPDIKVIAPWREWD